MKLKYGDRVRLKKSGMKVMGWRGKVFGIVVNKTFAKLNEGSLRILIDGDKKPNTWSEEYWVKI